MCKNKYCGTPREKYGYCVECGKEICEDCASADKKVHSKCIKNPTVITANPCLITSYPTGTAPDSGEDTPATKDRWV
ncbi:MAG: hypothetical protein SRB1_01145 [Desulfobacteraceae bacterium Eth-SRB1]|nr:MAG: hypothetical protein SRB1_01145 [Desulfobacteraceae bacterium Eth-SRB1]